MSMMNGATAKIVSNCMTAMTPSLLLTKVFISLSVLVRIDLYVSRTLLFGQFYSEFNH